MFFFDLDCLPLCVDNFWKIITFEEPNQPELWKTALKYRNLFSMTSKILDSYRWVFTVFTSVSVDSSACSFLFTSATVRIPFDTLPRCGAEAIQRSHIWRSTLEIGAV